MKKFFKQLAFVMALVLALGGLGNMNTKAADEIKLKKDKKTLYVNYNEAGFKTGANGFKIDAAGVETKSIYKHKYKINVVGAAEDDTISYKLKDKATMKEFLKVTSTGRIYAIKANGTTPVVAVATVKGADGEVKAALEFKVTIKQNAEGALHIKEAADLAADAALAVGISGAKPAADATVTVEPAIDLTVDKAADKVNNDYVNYEFFGTDAEKADYALIADLNTKTGEIWTKKAGTFKVRAFAFQSNKLNGHTQESAILTIKAASTMLSAKESARNAVEATFDSAMTGIANTTDLKISYVVGTTPVYYTVKSATVDSTDAKKVTFVTYDDFAKDTEYTVAYGDAKFTFKGVDTAANAVETIKFVTTTSVVEKETEIKVQLLDKNGVDLYNSDLRGKITWTTENYDVVTLVTDGKVTFAKIGDKATIKAEYKSEVYDANYNDTCVKTATGVITCVPSSVTLKTADWNVYYPNGGSVDPAKFDFDSKTRMQKLAVGDTDNRLEVKLLYSDDSTAYSYDGSIFNSDFEFISNNESIVVIGGNQYVSGVAAGSTTIVVKYKGTAVAALPITVVSARKAAAIDISVSSPYLSMIRNSGADAMNDRVDVTIKVTDNLGAIMKNRNVTLSAPSTITMPGNQLENSSGSAATQTDADGKIYFKMDAEELKNWTSATKWDPTTVPAASYTFKVEAWSADGKTSEVNKSFAISAAKPATTVTGYGLQLSSTSQDIIIKTDDKVSDTDVTFSLYAYNGNYKVKPVTKLFSSHDAIKTARIANTVSGEAFYYDIYFNGSKQGKATTNTAYPDTTSGVVDVRAASNKVFAFLPVYPTSGGAIANKVDAGSYKIVVTKVTSADALSTASNSIVTITDTQPAVSVVQDKAKVSVGTLTGILHDAFTFKVSGTEKDSTTVTADPSKDYTVMGQTSIAAGDEIYFKFAKYEISMKDSAGTSGAVKFYQKFPVNGKVVITD